MCRFGGRDSYPLAIGDHNDNFLAYGTLVGFAIIVPAILFTYLLGANLTILVRNDTLSPNISMGRWTDKLLKPALTANDLRVGRD